MTDNKDNVTYFDFRRKKPVEAPNQAGASPKDAFKNALDSLLNAVEDAPKQEQPKSKKPRRKTSQKIIGDGNEQSSSSQVGSQYIKGNNNKQTINIFEASKSVKREILPTPGTIGANIGLKNRISALFKQINEYREKRFGSQIKRGAIYGQFATAFGLNDYKLVYTWDEHRADEVVQWLVERLDNTQQGRVNRAKKNEGYQHSRGELFAFEEDYVEQLGWPKDKTKNIMCCITGKSSRADMDYNEFSNWVMYLRSEVEKMYGETGD